MVKDFEDIVILKQVIDGNEKTITRIRRPVLLKLEKEAIGTSNSNIFFDKIDKFIEGLDIGLNTIGNLFK